MGLQLRMLLATLCFTLVAVPAAARAQRADSAGFAGRVLRATDHAGIPGAEVSFPSLGVTVIADSTGAFRFAALPVGLQAVQIRHLGSGIWRDTVTIGPAGTVVRRSYALAETPTALDTVHAIAGKQVYLSPALRAFEDRRLSGQGGYFISDSTIRRNESSTLANLVSSRIPGLTPVYLNHARKALASTRKQCRGLVLAGGSKCRSGGPPDCYIAIYVDGTLYFNAKMADNGVDPPDVERDFNLAQFAGIEFYSGGASMPMGMHPDDDGCGSLWMWTRER